MQHAGQRHVAHILTTPLNEPRKVRSRHHPADIGVRPIERCEFRRQVGGDLHGVLWDRGCPARCSAAGRLLSPTEGEGRVAEGDPG
jgi:hypothetical protein